MAVYKNDANLQGLWLVNNDLLDDTDNNNDLTDNNTVGYDAGDKQEGTHSLDLESTNSEYGSITDGDQTGLDIDGDQLTLLAWVKPESTGTFGLIVRYVAAAGDRSYRLQLSSSNMDGYISTDGSAFVKSIGATNLGTGSWKHVAMVYNGTDQRLYLDGSLDSNGSDNPKATTGNIYDSATTIAIGAYSNGSNPFDGLMDEVAIFDRALSAAEISDVFNNGIQDAPSVVLLADAIDEDENMEYIIEPGATDQTIDVFLRRDDTGQGKTGLVYNSAGASCYYNRPRAAATQIALATLASATAAYSSGGFKEIDATNKPGCYRLDLPDAVVAAGADWVDVEINFDGVLDRKVTIALNIASAADIKDEVDDALTDQGLDHLVATAVVGADVADNSIFGKLVSKEATADWDDFDNTTDSLQALADFDLFTEQMTEAYAADGVAPTLAQALFAIMQNICEISKSGTTLTIKKLDGVTTAMTFTLDAVDDPSSRTRSS
jgi:hypothetical protein